MSATMVAAVSTLVNKGVGLVSNYFENKKADKALDAKLELVRQNKDADIQLSDKDWERLGKRNEGNGWKDEYATIVVTLPLLNLIVCTILGTIMEMPELILASQETLTVIKTELPAYDRILEVTIYAALSIRVGKAVR